MDIVSTLPGRGGEQERLGYDYLINATGPKLNFAATPGLGPDGNSLSVCTPGHAQQAARALDGVIEKLRAGQHQTLVIGVGHGMCTCEGAAFEYTFNVEHELRTRGLRDLADVIYLSNEYELGDFGVGGMVFAQQGFLSSSQIWTESLFRERGVKAILRAHVERVEPGKIYYETLDGSRDALAFDFAMLLPPFRGADLKAYDRAGAEITADLFAPSGFLKVDADYTPKPRDQWRAEDWPQTYQSPRYANLFGIGIAFAPPHAISHPAHQPQRHGDRTRSAAHRHAVRGDGPPGRPQHRGHDPPWRHPADAHRLDGGHGRGLHRLRRHGDPHRHRRGDDDVPRRPGLRPVPGARAQRERHLRRDRAGRALGQAPAPLRVHLQGQGPPRLGLPARMRHRPGRPGQSRPAGRPG